MRQRKLLHQIVGLLLSLAIALPPSFLGSAPAFALKPAEPVEGGGLKELQKSLQAKPMVGLEEKDIQKKPVVPDEFAQYNFRNGHHAGAILSLAFSQDPKRKWLVSAGQDGGIRVWDWNGIQKFKPIQYPGVQKAAFSTTASAILCVGLKRADSYDASNSYWVRPRQIEFPIALLAEQQLPGSTAFSPDRRLLLVGGHRKKAIILNLDPSDSADYAQRGGIVTSIKPKSGEPLSVAFDPRQKIVALGTTAGTVELWDIRNAVSQPARRMKILTGHGGPVSSVLMSPRGLMIASGDANGIVRLWKGGKVIRELRQEEGAQEISMLAFNPEGTVLAAGGKEGTLTVWNVKTGESIRQLRGPHSILALAFSPDGTKLVVGRSTNVISMIDIPPAGMEESLENYLRHVSGGEVIRWRPLTSTEGLKRSYDALAREQLPNELVPELASGLVPLLDRLERENGEGTRRWRYVDAGSGFGWAIREAVSSGRYPNMDAVTIDKVRWTENDVPPQWRDQLAHEAARRKIQNPWNIEGDDKTRFIQEDIGTADLTDSGRMPPHLITCFGILNFNSDPLKLLVHLYNQLENGGYLLAQLHIPTDYPSSRELLDFYDLKIFPWLRRAGIQVDWSTIDAMQKGGAVPGLGPSKEYVLGIVLKKTPGSLSLLLQNQPKPITYRGFTHRRVEFHMVHYQGDEQKPFELIPPAGMEEKSSAAEEMDYDKLADWLLDMPPEQANKAMNVEGYLFFPMQQVKAAAKKKSVEGAVRIFSGKLGDSPRFIEMMEAAFLGEAPDPRKEPQAYSRWTKAQEWKRQQVKLILFSSSGRDHVGIIATRLLRSVAEDRGCSGDVSLFPGQAARRIGNRPAISWMRGNFPRVNDLFEWAFAPTEGPLPRRAASLPRTAHALRNLAQSLSRRQERSISGVTIHEQSIGVQKKPDPTPGEIAARIAAVRGVKERRDSFDAMQRAFRRYHSESLKNVEPDLFQSLFALAVRKAGGDSRKLEEFVKPTLESAQELLGTPGGDYKIELLFKQQIAKLQKEPNPVKGHSGLEEEDKEERVLFKQLDASFQEVLAALQTYEVGYFDIYLDKDQGSPVDSFFSNAASNPPSGFTVADVFRIYAEQRFGQERARAQTYYLYITHSDKYVAVTEDGREIRGRIHAEIVANPSPAGMEENTEKIGERIGVMRGLASLMVAAMRWAEGEERRPFEEIVDEKVSKGAGIKERLQRAKLFVEDFFQLIQWQPGIPLNLSQKIRIGLAERLFIELGRRLESGLWMDEREILSAIAINPSRGLPVVGKGVALADADALGLIRRAKKIVGLPTDDSAAGMEEKSLDEFIIEEIRNVRPDLLAYLGSHLETLKQPELRRSDVKRMIRTRVRGKQLDNAAKEILEAVRSARREWIEYREQVHWAWLQKKGNSAKTNLAHESPVGRHPFAVRIFLEPTRKPSSSSVGSEGWDDLIGFSYPSSTLSSLLARPGAPSLYAVLDLLNQRLFHEADLNTGRIMALAELATLDAGWFQRALGEAQVPAEEQQRVLQVKILVEQSGMISPRAVVSSVMQYFLRAGERPYAALIESVNHVLTNQGKNPRIQGTSAPIQGIEDIDPEKGMDIWFIKEGRVTFVAQVLVHLKDGRQVKLAVNVAKDSREASEKLKAVFNLLSRNYAFDPTYVVEVFGAASIGGVGVMVGEWADGFDEIHLYPEHAPSFSVWRNQEMLREPLPKAVSDDLWYRAIWLQAYYTHFLPEGVVPSFLDLNAGDLTAAPEKAEEPNGPQKSLIIYAGGLGRGNSLQILLHAVLFIEAERARGGSGPVEYMWLDNPALAVRATMDGLEAHLRRVGEQAHWPEQKIREEIKQQLGLFLYHADEAFPDWIEDPSKYVAFWDKFSEDDWQRAVRILQAAHEELRRYIAAFSAGMEEIVPVHGAVEVPLDLLTIPEQRAGVYGINLVREILAVRPDVVVGVMGSILIDPAQANDVDLAVYFSSDSSESFHREALTLVSSLMDRLDRQYQLKAESAPRMAFAAGQAANVWLTMRYKDKAEAPPLPIQLLIRSPQYLGAEIIDQENQEPLGGFNPLTPYYAFKDKGGIPLEQLRKFLTLDYPEGLLARRVSDWYESLIWEAVKTRSWRRLAMAVYAAGDMESAKRLIAEEGDFDSVLESLSRIPDFLNRIRQIQAPSAGQEEGVQVLSIDELAAKGVDLTEVARAQGYSHAVLVPVGTKPAQSKLEMNLFAHPSVTKEAVSILAPKFNLGPKDDFSDVVSPIPTDDIETANARLVEATALSDKGRSVVIALDPVFQKDLHLPENHPVTLLLSPDTYKNIDPAALAAFLARPKGLKNLILDLTSGKIERVTIDGKDYDLIFA